MHLLCTIHVAENSYVFQFLVTGLMMMHNNVSIKLKKHIYTLELWGGELNKLRSLQL